MQLPKPKLDQLYQHTGQAKEIANALQQAEAKQLAAACYELRAKWSLGTGNGSKGIHVTVQVAAETPVSQKVRFTTAIRFEHYVMAVLFLIITVGFFYQADWKAILLILVFWPLFHLWFQVVYRSQEQELVNKLVRRLRLQLLAPVK